MGPLGKGWGQEWLRCFMGSWKLKQPSLSLSFPPPHNFILKINKTQMVCTVSIRLEMAQCMVSRENKFLMLFQSLL